MRPLARLILSVLAVTALALPARAQAPERYADVRVSAPEGGAVAARLALAGVGVDHAVPEKTPDGVPALRTVLSEHDAAAARAVGLRVDVLTPDIAAAVAARESARLGGCPAAPAPITGSMGCYPTFDETVAILDAMRAEFPALVSARTQIGTTREGRPLWMVEVGDNPGVDEGEPEVLWTALHHAREPQGLAAVLLAVWDLLRRGDAEAQFLLANRRLFVVPVLNPDGYVYNQTTTPAGGGLWRKNRRANADGTRGVDLNRNYAYEWGRDNVGSSPNGASETYRGTAGFSEPETAAIRDFANTRRIRIALNYHAYGNLFIYPWGFEEDLYTPDSAQFTDQARAMTAANGYLAGTGNQTVNYVTNGDSDDWLYGDTALHPAVFSYTPEIGSAADGFWPDPDRIVPIATENLAMNRLSLRYAGASPAVAGVEAVDDGGNGFPDPGERALVRVTLTNLGLERLTAGATLALVSTNALVTVEGPGVTLAADVAPGARVVVGPFAVRIAPGAPLGNAAGLGLAVAGAGLFAETLALPPLRVGTPETIVADDASTLAGWTAAGGWGLSTAVFTSGPSSFADSPAGPYTNNTDRTLTRTASISVPAGASLAFRTRYDLEPGYDVATVEAQVGTGAWTPLAGRLTVPATGSAPVPAGTPVYTGSRGGFADEAVDLPSGPAVRVRFRLRSDGSQTRDGMYVDDIRIERLVNGGAVAGEPGAAPDVAVALGVPAPNPVRGVVRIPVALNDSRGATLDVFDALGRRAARLRAEPGVAEWDASGMAPGVYVVRLRTGQGEASRRIVVR
ncbi:MAG TPA: M14 family zinc carboxypeptidase [Rubricoccaceae bacterium]|jgi:hypothetical protein